MRRSTIGGQSAWFFAAISLTVAACGGDDGAGDTSETDDEATGDGDGDGDGDAKNCAKGEYPTQGEITFCPEAGDGCVAVEDARGYTKFYGNVNVRRVSDLEPLHCLESAGGLSISNGSTLKDLTGLANVAELASLTVVDNPVLESLSGLDSLTSLEYLSLIDNGLTSLPGLPEGLSVKNFSVEYHEQLTSLDGLEAIDITEKIAITDNPKLPQCEAEAFAATLSGVETKIENNDAAASCD